MDNNYLYIKFISMKPKPASNTEPNQPEKLYQPPKAIAPEDKAFMLTIGQRLLDLQRQAGISTVELCRRLSISRYTYLLISTGQVYWNSEKVLKLIKYYGMDAASFFRSL